MIEVTDALVHGDAFLGESVAVLFGDGKRVMRRGRKDGGHERFAHLGHLLAIELQERFVPDGPCAIEIVFTSESRISIVFGTTIVGFKTGGTTECLEAHRAVLCTMEEGRLITFAAKAACQATYFVERSGSKEEGFDEHRYTTENGGHGIDGFAPVGKRPVCGEGVAADLVDEGRISLVIVTALTEVVERADVFAAQTLNDDDDHITRNEGRGVGRIVLGGEDGIEFFLRCEISRIDKRLLAQRAND